MAKPKNVIPTVEKKFQIPSDLCVRMELELHSDLEGKIPYGAQSEFVSRLIRDHYQRIDVIRSGEPIMVSVQETGHFTIAPETAA